MVQWAKIRLMFILQCIIGFQGQSIGIENSFAQACIPKGGHVFIEIARYSNNKKEKCDVVIVLKKILCGEAEAAKLRYLKFQDSLLYSSVVVKKMDPCFFMPKTVICVA